MILPVWILPMRRLFGLLLAAAMTFAAGAASAHPHVWITATSAFLYAADGSLTGVRHVWTFDRAFSANAVQELHGKPNGTYSREELAPLAQAQVESWKEKAYFTFLKDKSKLPFAEPTDCFFEYMDDHLTLHFTLPLKTPVKSKTIWFEIVDRSFFNDIEMADGHPVTLVGAPTGCEVWRAQPIGNDRDRKMVQEASEDSFKEGGANVAVGLLFDNRFTVECP